MEKNEIESLVNEVVKAKGRMTRAEIDACCCRTDRDWDHFHKMEEEYYEIYERVVDKLYRPFVGQYDVSNL